MPVKLSNAGAINGSTALSQINGNGISSGDLTQITAGNAYPMGWWLNVPANALSGTYTSTLPPGNRRLRHEHQ